VAGAASAAALNGAVNQSATASAQTLPAPEASQIEHIILVMMENRSFDHLLGWLPGANGRQAGLSYTDKAGESHPTMQLTTFVGCAHPDPNHSYAGGRSEYDGGKMDGWLRTTTNDTFSIGYYVEAQLPFFSALASNFTTLDNYFASILASTFPNHVFEHAAQTDRLSNTLDLCTLPTIWDNLKAAGVSARYYCSNVPFLALWGERYVNISAPFTQSLTDASVGRMPAVSFVDPRFTILDDGGGNDDHPTPTSALARPSSARSTARLPRAPTGQYRPHHQSRRMGRLLRHRCTSPGYRPQWRRHRSRRRQSAPRLPCPGDHRLPRSLGETLPRPASTPGSTITPRCSN
jgi:phospholipase C